MKGNLAAAAVLLAVFLLWEAGVRAFKVKPIILPAPSAVFADLFSAPGWYLGHAWYTLLVTLAGFALSVLVGVLLAILIVESRLLEKSIYALIVGLNSVPKVAVAPLFVIWLGTDAEPKIAIAFLIAVFAIVIAAVLDGLDGRIARLLDSTSKFGAELDSLSDFVSFGVAPAILLYYWTLQGAGGAGWVISLLFGVCVALRLARFNTRIDNDDLPAWTSRFFVGVPAPAGAGLSLMPVAATLEFGRGVADSPILVGFTTVAVAALMVSRLPTFSMKRVRVPHHLVVLTLLGVACWPRCWSPIPGSPCWGSPSSISRRSRSAS